VIGPRDLALEVQIRTHEMHHHSELGVAAHWRYKEGGKSDAKFDEKIAWLRQILEWKEEVADSGDMLEQFKSELFHDSGLRSHATGAGDRLAQRGNAGGFCLYPAYRSGASHPWRESGRQHRSPQLQTEERAARGNSRRQTGFPSRDWINPTLGYLQSPRARAKVRHWFKYLNFDENVSQGRAQLERELHRWGVVAINQEKIAQRLNFNKLEELLAAIGRGDVNEHQIAQAFTGGYSS